MPAPVKTQISVTLFLQWQQLSRGTKEILTSRMLCEAGEEAQVCTRQRYSIDWDETRRHKLNHRQEKSVG